MDALEAIRKRRSVRRYTDKPVSDADVEELVRLALIAPSGGMSQAWSIIVVRSDAGRAKMADLITRGGAEYFRTVRPAAEGTSPDEHAEWAKGYAGTVLETYPKVPVWILALRVPRGKMPADQAKWERDTDMTSVGFMVENLLVAARAKGLGTVPTVFQWYVEDEFREAFAIPDEVEIPLVTPLGYPEEFPTSLPPALQKIRRPWKTLVHDEAWGNARA